MKFGFISQHRGIWPMARLCTGLGVHVPETRLGRPSSKRSRGGFGREGTWELHCMTFGRETSFGPHPD